MQKDCKPGRLSVIMPYVREFPQNIFTLMNVYEELRDRCDFEIIAVNNFVPGHVKTGQGVMTDDQGQDAFDAAQRGYPEIISLKYDKKLSHWQAKNHAVSHSTGEFLFFVDAHCVVSRDSLFEMFNFFKCHHGILNGSIHMNLTYKIHDWKPQIYEPRVTPSKGEVAYRFCTYREPDWEKDSGVVVVGQNARAFEVPCMSNCGIMLTRNHYETIGGWPTELGIYGGGEHFMNYASAILGYKKWIWAGGPLRHHGAERGYSWNFSDYHRNRLIANYMFGGKEWLYRYAKKAKPSLADVKLFKSHADGIIANQACLEHRELIKSRAVMTIEDWLEKNNLI